MFPHRFRVAALLVVMSIVWNSGVVGATEHAAVTSGRLQVAVHDGLLTLDARDAPLGEVVRAIGEVAGIEILLHGNLDAPVHRAFANLPVEEGIRQLLAGAAYVMTHVGSNGRGRPSVLHVYAPGSDPARARPRVRPAVLAVAEPSQDERVSWVRDRLASDDLGAQVVAVRRLTSLEPAVAVEIARRILRSEEDPVVRGQTAIVLAKIDAPGVVQLLEVALVDEDTSVRLHAATALRTVGGDSAVEVLERAVLDDADPGVRVAAIEALAELAPDSSRRYFERATFDRDAEVRDTARRALERRTADAGDEPRARGARPAASSTGMQYRGNAYIE